MLKILATALTGLAISTCGYFALNGVDFSAALQTGSKSGTPPMPAEMLPAPSLGESRPVRVCLTDHPARSVRLKIDGPFTVRTVGSEKPLHAESSLKECTVKFSAQSLQIGRATLSGTRFEIVPENSPAIWINDHQYRGTIRIYRQPGGKLLAINVLPLEDYIAGVVDSEMPAAFPNAARKAQAICSRTYAVYQMAQSRSHPYFDLYASTRSQNYLGFQYLKDGKRLAGETERGREIAKETAGLICVHDGEVFCTYYSAVCGGSTTRGDLVFTDAAPPLQSVGCEWCRDARFYRWTEKHSLQSAANKLSPFLGSSRGPISSIRRADGEPLTPASLFRVSNGQRQAEISAVELRRRFTLPSTTFEIRRESSQLLFEGRGHGHGVGLCQWGARGMALAGKSAAEILKHYYPGCQIAPMP